MENFIGRLSSQSTHDFRPKRLAGQHIEFPEGPEYTGCMNLSTSTIKPSEPSFLWSSAMSARFLPVAILFYVVALGANLTYVLNDQCIGFAFFPGRTDLFVGIILFLIGFELWVYRRYGSKMTRRTGIGLLITRMVLIEAALSVDCTGFTTFLYLLLPFLVWE